MEQSERSEIEELEETKAVNVDPTEIIPQMEKNLNMLAAMCAPEKMLFLFPHYFMVIWELWKSKLHLFRDFSKIAIGIPRGFAKTTLVKFLVVYCILFTKKKCIVIVSYKEEHAANIIADVITYLQHPNIVALFGLWSTNQTRDQQDCKVFAFRGRTIVLAGLGSKGSIRGLNLDDARPDVMIFDDYQKKDESENEEISKKLYKDMMGTWLKAKSPFGCLYIFVANMYPTVGSILKKLKNNKDWTSFIVGGILADGTSLWEDLQPINQLIAEYEGDLLADCPEVFLSEVLNDENAGLKAGIDITKIPAFPFPEYELPQGRAIVIDPASNKAGADYNGIGLVGLFDGKGCLEKAILGRYSPLELIKQALILAFQTSTRLICVEDVALQSTYLFWFNKVCEDNGIEGFYFMPLKIGGGSKNAKSKATILKISKGEIWLKTQAKPLVVNEIIKFDPLKAKNQDTALDLAGFVDKVIEQYGELMLMPYEPEMQAAGDAGVRDELETSCF